MTPLLHRDLNRWPDRLRELFEERAAIMEFQGNMERKDAEKAAEQDIRNIAYEDWT